MFDWFFDFLYLLTRSIFKIVDALLAGANALSGLEPVVVEGQKTDLLSWIMALPQVATGFKVTALVGIFLIVFFTIWQICKTIVTEKPEGTPAQLCIKAFKTVMTFLFIPAAMYVATQALNAIAEVLINGTRGGSDITLGAFLAKSFGQDCQNSGLNVWTADDFDYTSFDCMWKYFNMRHYDYFFSWVAGITILMTLSKVLFIFVERMFSIILLYIISPIPMAVSIIDDGQKFKAWREQLIAKFCVGYGAILGLNIYTIVLSALCTYEIEYFSNGFLNFVFKLVVIVGGAFGVDKLVAMIGNLISNGAGDSAMADAAAARQGVGAVGKGVGSLAMKAGKLLAGAIFGGKKGGGKSAGGKGPAEGKSPAAAPSASAADPSAGGSGGGGSGGGGSESGGSGNKNPFLNRVSEGFKNFGNKVKSTFKGLFTKNPMQKKGPDKGITVGKGSNGGFTLGSTNKR